LPFFVFRAEADWRQETMKISEFESGKAGTDAQAAAKGKILPEEFRASLHREKRQGRPKTSREEAIEVAMKALEEVPDVREDLVADIKARLERGEYRVDPAEVGEMMLRRMRADRIR
jgi:anti-sigma28 factor (negative regulator of flagellin synthesis)